MKRMRRAVLPVGLIVGVLVGAGGWLLRSDGDGAEDHPIISSPRVPTTNDPIERACALDDDILLRLWRGHDPVHSEDVTTVPNEPNYSGTFTITSHSGPWDYLQNVPLVLYGPGVIRASEEAQERDVSLVDLFPTVGELVGVDLPDREGVTLDEAFAGPGRSTPKLVLVLVWDGVGRNVLERWPDAWPALARLEREGTSFVDAVVGSSPSITPATHSSLGTGAYPRTHGVTAIEYRTDDGKVRGAFAGRDPSDLKLTTFADEIDLALHNSSKAGMLAWRSWHLGMLGHGTATPGGDADELALIGNGEKITGNPAFYTTPAWLKHFEGLHEHADELDRADGAADGRWRGHDILALHDNPAWVAYETDALLAMLRRGGYGADDVVDLFFANYKMTDIVGHQYTMDSPEMSEVLAAQDAALGRIVDYLDAHVGDYVVVVTADHGHTPKPESTGAWPILQGQLEDDINANFDVPAHSSLVVETSAAGPFLDRDVMDELGVSASQVARFLNGYTIAENHSGDELPEGYEDRGDEPVLSAAFTAHQYDDVMRCAFGAAGPGS